MGEWSVSWAYQPMDFCAFPIQAGNERQRVSFLNNLAGSGLRLKLSNRYGSAPLCLDALRVGLEGQTPEEMRALCVNGRARIRIEPGTAVYSDEIEFALRGGERIVVETQAPAQLIYTAASVFPQEITGVEIVNTDTGRTRVRAETGLLRIEPEQCCFYGVCRAEVRTQRPVSTVLCFGDSITHRSLWTAPLAAEMYARYPGECALINYGVSGNRMLHDESPYTDFGLWFGKRGVERIRTELSDVPSLSAVIVLHGINDIYHPLQKVAPAAETVSAGQLIDGLKRYADEIHRAGANACACTITPFNDAGGVWSVAAEATRRTVNDWIRSNGLYDCTADFDAAIAQADDPTRMRPECDSGDNLHPGTIGGLQMAACFNREMLDCLLKK